MTIQLLRAAPYEFRGRSQPGKMHAIREGGRTFCGHEYQYTGGDILEGDRSEVTCKLCIRSMDAQDSYQESREKWEAIAAEREQRNQEWWARYSLYLKTPDWAKRRRLVFRRARGLCEGCLEAPPVHVHHLSYDHAGDELLYELVALCTACHQKAHPDKEIGGDW